ncbi:hypothetical protein BCR44DRAFT_1442265 [Catenaria anguillulae PL171]|uniref:Uncharacterized protein n=1 Tax=Catenaria anguillulae PL171 TaxID=765915 RepID=A0A1Y2HEB0_9FUNG|nr:hypothetical protein BCR44DRAFT_1442265 [Catenaria anguillulae PL171]
MLRFVRKCPVDFVYFSGSTFFFLLLSPYLTSQFSKQHFGRIYSESFSLTHNFFSSDVFGRVRFASRK